MTANEYKDNVLKAQYFITSLPLLTLLLKSKSPIPFPPLGDNQIFWRIGAVILAGCSLILPYYFLSPKHKRVTAGVIVALLILSISIYMRFQDNYVVTITFTGGPKSYSSYVIRGSERNPDLTAEETKLSDIDLIEHVGLHDTDLKRAYTKDSLHATRLKLFWSYTSVLMLVQMMFGVFGMEPDKPKLKSV